VYLDGNCYCGISFGLIGNDLRINQLHGVRGLNLCPYTPMRHNWERTLVEAAHDLGFRILLIRAEHANSWRTASPELRERLRKRMDGSARTLGLRPMGAHWVWESDAGAAFTATKHNAQVGPIQLGGFISAVSVILKLRHLL
jgi:hypothetical protein